MKFILEKSFFDLFPEAVVGVAILEGIDNRNYESSPEIKELLIEANREAHKHFTGGVFSENPVIKVWREAYQKFKKKKGVRCSIEALLKRVEKGEYISSINPLVDIYNSVSLKFGLPCGAEDKDKFSGDLRLGITNGGDYFVALGEEEESPTLEGELCYRDDEGAVCRCFNWRDSERTKVSEESKNIFVAIESLEPHRRDDVKEALETIKRYAEKSLGAEGKIYILDKNNTEIEI